MNWLYKNDEITSIDQFPKDVMGFIYKIEHIPTNKSYIGKKFLVFTRKQKLGARTFGL